MPAAAVTIAAVSVSSRSRPVRRRTSRDWRRVEQRQRYDGVRGEPERSHLAAGGDDHRDRAPGDPVGHEGQHGQGAGVDPLGVVDQDHQAHVGVPGGVLDPAQHLQPLAQRVGRQRGQHVLARVRCPTGGAAPRAPRTRGPLRAAGRSPRPRARRGAADRPRPRRAAPTCRHPGRPGRRPPGCRRPARSAGSRGTRSARRARRSP